MANPAMPVNTANNQTIIGTENFSFGIINAKKEITLSILKTQVAFLTV